MRVFVTGATGFVGSVVVKALIAADHDVLGLARSEAAAKSLNAVGAKVHLGDLEDLKSLQVGAQACEGVIHMGFIHDFARFKEVCEIDRRAIEALGAALAGSERPLIVTSGTALISPGRLATEEDLIPSNTELPRLSEQTALSMISKGVRAASIRLAPSVHGEGDHGFVPLLINLAREKGVSAYVGDGLNRWNAVHRLDVADLYRLALEKAPAGARYHGVAEEGIAFKEIAEIIGEYLNVPVESKSHEEAAQHFGWFAHFAGLDCPASSKLTQERLDWHPVQPTLINDLHNAGYFNA